jgi:selenocysteine-specific elongation factor
MHVIATAGHVDHGKSALVRALTGIEPDRWAEERRRGLTLDLGFAWTTTPAGHRLAFVDVPGHERFVATMLAGVGPVPAVMFVVAADQGWQAQSQEHWEALGALGVQHGLLVISRCDLMEPDLALEEAREHTDWPAVCVSAHTGEGLGGLTAALDRLADALPAPDTEAPVRLWIDRAFTMTGSGTVVTGTLGAGRLSVGDLVELDGAREGARTRVRVRGLQSLGEPAESVEAVARVAVNLRGVDHRAVRRGMRLLTPDAWPAADLVDVHLDSPGDDPPRETVLHIGSTALTARVRPLGDLKDRVRLALVRPLPLRIADRGLLRLSGRPMIGVQVLDVRPPRLRRRGAGARRAAQLAELGAGELPDAAMLLRWNGLLPTRQLTAMGADPSRLEAPGAGEWLVDPGRWRALGERLSRLVAEQPGIPVDAARVALGLPDRRLVEVLAEESGLADLRITEGRIGGHSLSPEVAEAVKALRGQLERTPFQAPEGARLTELGLGSRELGAAARLGELLRLAEGIVLLPDAPTRAARILAELPQPFTASEARAALDTTRRVIIPLLEHLDAKGHTRRVDATRRTVRRSP